MILLQVRINIFRKVYIALATTCFAGRGGEEEVFAGLSLSVAVITFVEHETPSAQQKMVAWVLSGRRNRLLPIPC